MQKRVRLVRNGMRSGGSAEKSTSKDDNHRQEALYPHITRSDANFKAILTTPKPPWDGGKEAEDRLSHSLLLFHTKAKTDLVILGGWSELTGTVEPKYQKRLIPSIHAINARPGYDNLRCCQERKTLSSALSAGSQS